MATRLQGLGVGPLEGAGGYTLVVMAATTAATTQAPLTAAVMIFELSGDYPIVLPLHLSTVVATALSRMVADDSVYAMELRRRRIAWEVTLDGRRLVEWRRISRGWWLGCTALEKLGRLAHLAVAADLTG